MAEDGPELPSLSSYDQGAGLEEVSIVTAIEDSTNSMKTRLGRPRKAAKPTGNHGFEAFSHRF